LVAGEDLERLLLAENINLDAAPWAAEYGNWSGAPVVWAILFSVYEVAGVYRGLIICQWQ
jgi:hypothetical protein